MIPALLGLIAPVAAVKVLSGFVRAAGAALRSAAAPAALPVPPVVEKAAEVSEQVSDSPVIFAYDGMSRRTKITELTNGTVTSKKLYWWLGGTIVCERDGLVSGFPITKRYFGQGLVQGVTKLFYTFDHLGSVRELVDDAGTVQALYRYSTYGERTKETGNLDSDWGYAGLWHHGPSGLDLATYRLYDAKNRRWISRDPLGEGVDYNLYRYCGNNPVGCIDPNGLRPLYPFPNVMQNAYHAARSVIDAEHPYWRTEVGLANDAYWTPAENEAGKPLAGNTGQGAGDDTSYINFARLSRIQDNDSRFFEVLHTLAHELWHQNNPTPRKDLFGSDFIEDEADAYADHVVETYVLKQCNPHRKRKYRLWKSKRKKVRDQAGRDTLKW